MTHKIHYVFPVSEPLTMAIVAGFTTHVILWFYPQPPILATILIVTAMATVGSIISVYVEQRRAYCDHPRWQQFTDQTAGVVRDRCYRCGYEK